MKRIAMLAASILIAGNAYAAKSCDELKSEIAAKIDAKGVKEYSLDVIANEAVAEGKVVGSCDGGTRKIVYTRK